MKLARRVLIPLLLACSLVVVTAPPVHAGDGYSSPSGCDGGRRAHEGNWWGVPGRGSWYQWHALGGVWIFVGDVWYQIFRDNNWECGPFGWPKSSVNVVQGGLYNAGSWMYQEFERATLHYYYGRWVFCVGWNSNCTYI